MYAADLSVLIREPPTVGKISNLRELLRDIGVEEVVATPYIDEAIALLDASRFDVFFFGLEDARDVKTLENDLPDLTANIDIIVASPPLPATARSLIEDSGVNTFVELPATSNILERILARVARRLPSLSANVHGLSVPDVLQVYHQSRRTIEIVIEGPVSGVVSFVEGEITQISCDGLFGVQALSRLIGVTEGHIRTNSQVVRRESELTFSFQQLLLEAALLIDQPRQDSESSDFGGFTSNSNDRSQQTFDDLCSKGEIKPMADGQALNTALRSLEQSVTGFIGASIVDMESGMTLAAHSSRSDFDLSIASAYNSKMVKHKLHTIAALKLNTDLEDMLLTLGTQLHLIRLISSSQFLYLAADKNATNLALMRIAVGGVVDKLA